jgi:hypothetical protein
MTWGGMTQARFRRLAAGILLVCRWHVDPATTWRQPCYLLPPSSMLALASSAPWLLGASWSDEPLYPARGGPHSAIDKLMYRYGDSLTAVTPTTGAPIR